MSRTNTGVRFFLKNPKSKINPIKGIFCYANKQLTYYERKLSIPTKYWNAKNQRAKESLSFPDHERINQTLQAIESITMDSYSRFKIDKGREPDLNELRRIIKDKRGLTPIKKDERIYLINFVKAFIADAISQKHKNTNTGKPVKLITIRTYSQTLNLLEQYSKSRNKTLLLDDVTIQFHNDFLHFLTHEYKSPLHGKSCMPNTAGKHITNIKTFMSAAFDQKLTTNEAFRLKGFRVIHENVENVYLTEEEIQELINLDLSKENKLDRARDIFIIGCFTGLRISDLKRLSEKHLQTYKGDNIIQIEMKKTEKPVRILISPEVAAIISKYRAQIGAPFPKFISDQKCNDYIKEVAKRVDLLQREVAINRTEEMQRMEKTVPKWQLISNHTARRSFATNLILAGYSNQTVMQFTGHKTEKSFLRYVKIDGLDAIDMMKHRRSQPNNLRLVS